MKFRTTKKYIRGYEHILNVGNGEIQHLLAYESPIAYSTRAEGWACDYYELSTSDARCLVISSGYAPINSKNASMDYSRMREYDEQARTIKNDSNKLYEVRADEMKKLLRQFADEAMKGTL
jgi:hypothetical protein